jgi:hypothetical protein
LGDVEVQGSSDQRTGVDSSHPGRGLGSTVVYHSALNILWCSRSKGGIISDSALPGYSTSLKGMPVINRTLIDVIVSDVSLIFQSG